MSFYLSLFASVCIAVAVKAASGNTVLAIVVTLVIGLALVLADSKGQGQ